MIKILKNLTVALFIILSIIFMIIETEYVMIGVKTAIMLWATRVFPILFPFYIFSSLAVRYGVAHLIGDLIKPITRRLFKTSSISGFIFFMSLLSGNPSSAIIISQVYEDGSITKTEAQHLLSFCVFVNPIFCIGTIGYAYFHNVTIGYVILISHIAANILIGILMRYNIKTNYQDEYSLKEAYAKMVKHKNKHKTSFGETITTILQSGMNTMFLIGGFMIFYNLIIVMITSSQFIKYSYQYIFHLFDIQYKTYNAFFIGIFEMVLGVDNVIKSSFPTRIATTFITMLISFGGLSIHSQIQSILLKIKLKYLPFFISRLAQMIFSGVIAYYLFPYFYQEKIISTFYIYHLHIEEKNILLLSILLLLITYFVLITLKKNIKKV
ncbi:hypothetical protein KHQ81_04060 [Mycoplasmatota bacterium]|nr:hypothetical protein KHQ81_04060 [Mycoplasmatota bacterium]